MHGCTFTVGTPPVLKLRKNSAMVRGGKEEKKPSCDVYSFYSRKPYLMPSGSTKDFCFFLITSLSKYKLLSLYKSFALLGRVFKMRFSAEEKKICNSIVVVYILRAVTPTKYV